MVHYAWGMRILIAGISGMVGSAIALEAKAQGHEVWGKTSKELDLTDRAKVFAELATVRPDALIIAAAKVGGIGANSSFPVEFLSTNIQIQTNLLDGAHTAKIERVLFLGSSCIYPKFAHQPIPESALMTGELEESNAPYAIAKIAGIKLVQSYRKEFNRHWISAMPTNLYGPRDNFDLENSHVVPALIRRFYEAKIAGAQDVQIWGDGTPLRELLFVEDLARACLMLIEEYDEVSPINIGSGYEISILELSKLIAGIVSYSGRLSFDTSRPNGTPRKILDSTQILDMGWRPQVDIEAGIIKTYRWFIENEKGGNLR